MLNKKLQTDYLIIGGGLAGLYSAYKASKFGKVLVVTKTNSEDSNSWLAQGGIAVTLGNEDLSFRLVATLFFLALTFMTIPS